IQLNYVVDKSGNTLGVLLEHEVFEELLTYTRGLEHALTDLDSLRSGNAAPIEVSYYAKAAYAHAVWYPLDRKIQVKKGSCVAERVASSIGRKYKTLRDRLIADRIIALDEANRLRFTSDYTFS